MPVDVTEKYVRIRSRDPGEFEEGSFRTIVISKDDGISAVIGKLKGETSTTVQTYLFDKEKWDTEKAKKWVTEHKEKKAADFNELVVMLKADASLDEQSRQIRNAFDSQFNPAPNAQPKMESYQWVKECFETEVIVETQNGLFSYPYTIDTEGKVKFGEPVKVRVAYIPIKESPTETGKALSRTNPTGLPLAIKSLRTENGGVVVGGYMALWGSPEKKDLQGDYFTPETETWIERYPTVPALFHHGLDEAIGLAVVGKRIKALPDDTGLWVEDWLDTSSRYWCMVKPLLEAEALFYSPGSAPHLVKREPNGRIKTYPIVEDTMTPIPAQHRQRPVEQIKLAYKSAGLPIPELAEVAGGAGAPQPAEATKAIAEAIVLLTDISNFMEG